MLSELLEVAQRPPLRLNVHLCLPGPLQRAARAINAELSAQVPSAVDLGPTSLHLPHLTLSMGYVDSALQLTETAREVARLAASSPPIPLEMTHVSLTPARDSGFVYAFLEVTPTRRLMELRARIHASLASRYVDVGRESYPFEPHVTVGYTEATVAPALSPVQRQVAVADRLGLALAGDRGVCLGRLGEYYLSAL